MPSKHIVKPYLAGGIYHVFNRGVEKRSIFLDEQDYSVFLKFLKEAISKPQLQGSTLQRRRVKNFHGEIELYAFCLMPNHFHLLLKQLHERTMKQFMQSLATRYSMYFNKKYKRVGALFQNVYKASHVTEDPYLLHVTGYIHRNPMELTRKLTNAHSSYKAYCGIAHYDWLNTEMILSYFKTSMGSLPRTIRSYRDFVEHYETEFDIVLQG